MAKVSFNYDSLKDTKVARTARENAKQIKTLLQKTAESVVQIGRLMASVREGLTPAVFLAWVDCEFGWVQSVASNYMQAAAMFNDLDCLKQIQPTAIIRLARKNVPESVIKEAIAKARAGEMVTSSMVNRMLVAAGHQPTHPSAGKTRKPQSLRSIAHAPVVSVEQLSSSLDELSKNIGAMTLAQAEREALAAKFFELAMNLRMPAPVQTPPRKGATKKEPVPEVESLPAVKPTVPKSKPAAPAAKVNEKPEPEIAAKAPAKAKPAGKKTKASATTPVSA